MRCVATFSVGNFWKKSTFHVFLWLKNVFFDWLKVWFGVQQQNFTFWFNFNLFRHQTHSFTSKLNKLILAKIWKKACLKIWVQIYFWCQNRLKLNKNVKFCYYTPNQTFKLVKKPLLSPKKAQKMYFYKKFPREKVATHLKSFLGVIRNIWHRRNACDKKKIQHLLETQCDGDEFRCRQCIAGVLPGGPIT